MFEWKQRWKGGWVAVVFLRCPYINLYTDERVILRRKSLFRSFWALLIAIRKRQVDYFPNLWIESNYLKFCGFSFLFKSMFICSFWALAWLKCSKTQNSAQGISVSEATSESTYLPLYYIWTVTKSFITLWVCEAGLQYVRDPVRKPFERMLKGSSVPTLEWGDLFSLWVEEMWNRLLGNR